VLLLDVLQAAYDGGYGMKRRGRAVIVANSTFREDKLNKRKGTEVDVCKLVHVLGDRLKFEVEVHRDLSSHVSYSSAHNV